HRYSAAFAEDHLIPMASALWSSPSAQVLKFPARYLVAFMANHHMLQVEGRPEWRVVQGRSNSYIQRLRDSWRAEVRLGATVSQIVRDEKGVRLRIGSDVLRFDQVVLACHSDQALAALADPSDAEREILGAIRYQQNDTVLHTDA